MKIKVVLFIIICCVVTAFINLDDSLFKIPDNWPKPKYDFSKNPLSKEKIELGRVLFYDPILSKDSSVSCNSCHSQYTAFAHVDHALSHGINNKIGKRNAPALANIAWESSFMWDGSVAHLDDQPLAPINNPDEMDEDMNAILIKLNRSSIYPDLFNKAFGNHSVSQENVLKAISQFMVTITSSNSKYDSVMRHQTIFTDQETNGYKLFQQNCSSCHKEPLFTSNQYENNGLAFDTTLNDIGRMKVTKDITDSMKFKVPTLRNLEFSYPYMHDGRFKKISDVLKHYTSGIKKSNPLSSKLEKPIVLSSSEKVDLTAFLLALTDRSFLFNQKYSYPKEILNKAQN